ncbi:MAG: DinB family protein [Vicinamibacterales bacterium]
MISATLAVVLMLAAAAAPRQQQPFTPAANPVTDAARARLARESKNLIAAADLLPADKYTYQPTPAQMTFGDLIAHIVQTNVALCSATSGTPAPMSPPELKKIAGADGKKSLVAAMKKSFDYCTEGFAKLQDSVLAEEAVFFGQRTGMSRANALITIVVDWADHYSTAASYLRLNGLLPPTAQPKK